MIWFTELANHITQAKNSIKAHESNGSGNLKETLLRIYNQKKSLQNIVADFLKFPKFSFPNKPLNYPFIDNELVVIADRYSLMSEVLNCGIWDWDLKSGKVYFSPQWQILMGYPEGMLKAEIETLFSRIHPDDFDLLKQKILNKNGSPRVRIRAKTRVLHWSGSYRSMEMHGFAIYDESNLLLRVVCSQYEINSQIDDEEIVYEVESRDKLTALPNRAFFLERLSKAVKRKRARSNIGFVVLYIDIDRFKLINDSLGHDFGDQLLAEFSLRIDSCVRSCDVPSRIGGDEFAILLEDIAVFNEAEKVIQRIQKALATPFLLDNHEIFITASIGLSFGRENYSRIDEALQEADRAMHLAKRRGKGQFEIFDQSTIVEPLFQLQLENDLARAIERQELQPFYQPIFDIQTNELVGFEALLRWNHSQRGMISPTEFIPIAEENGLIVTIGDWVLQSAFQQLADWQENLEINPKIFMCVNLSPLQFTQPSLIPRIQEILTDTQLDPQTLRFEITESVLIENPELAASILTDLKDMGIKLYLDDFGTGFSSLNHLKNFPVDAIKIDRSFVSNLHLEGRETKIVKGIISLAQQLDIAIVAEGIETMGQLKHLKDMSCQFGQGYLYNKPMDAKAVEVLLREIPPVSHGDPYPIFCTKL